jgi:hypothetical protein
VIVLRAPISGAALSPAGGFDVQLAARVFSSSDRVETVSEGASTAANGTTRIVNAGFGLEMTRPGQEIHAELFLSRAIRTSFRFANPAAAPAR